MTKNHRMLEKSLQILEYISQHTEGKTLAEICAFVEMPKSSVHSIVHTLANLGYVNAKKPEGVYTVGLKCFEIGSRYLNDKAFFQQVKKVLAKVSSAFNETTHFALLDALEVVYTHKFESTQAIRMVSSIGKRNPAHATALGKAILSTFSDEEIMALYDGIPLISLTEKTVVCLEVLLDQIRKIRQSGVAYESGESTPGIKCYAVPIRTPYKALRAAMSISIPLFRVEDGNERYVQELLEAKADLEAYAVEA